MGETGCGKTSLIEMAYKLLTKGTTKLKKMNIHAGISDDDIISFMKKINDDVAREDSKILENKKKEFNSLSEIDKKAYTRRNSISQIFKEYEKEISEREIWIFLDEINTCNSLGLITEILCKHSIYGKPLDKRYVFIAACNP